ncbi:NADP-dependent oxidoreductase [Enterococcus faecalis]|nr:NADP-dependent oxidoreductase [Enterococcus faecalis]
MMKAALIHKYGQKELSIEEVLLPTIHDNDVLVKIIAASINPIDLKTKDGKVKMLLNYQMPLILGSDFAGIVVSVGKNVQNFRMGDAVYGRVPKNRVGTFAEYIAVDQAAVAMKPKNLTFEEAAAIPLVGLTSYQALHDIMNVQPGQKVLIQAGSGGIGTIAIQLAKLAGAYVATTTSSRNKEWVQALGADEVIDYRTQNFEEVLSDYDYVFDTMGGTILEKAFSVVKPQGKVVTLSGIPNERFAKEYGLPLWKQWAFKIATRKIHRLEQDTDVSYHFLFMRPDGEQLALLTEFIEQGKLQPIIDRVIPFSQIQEAVDYSLTGRAQGKIVVKIADVNHD